MIFICLVLAELSSLVPVVQYYEFVHLYYFRYYHVASTLLCLTLSSTFLSTHDLYKKRKELFMAIDKQRLTPLVQNGRVRCSWTEISQLSSVIKSAHMCAA